MSFASDPDSAFFVYCQNAIWYTHLHGMDSFACLQIGYAHDTQQLDAGSQSVAGQGAPEFL